MFTLVYQDLQVHVNSSLSGFKSTCLLYFIRIYKYDECMFTQVYRDLQVRVYSSLLGFTSTSACLL